MFYTKIVFEIFGAGAGAFDLAFTVVFEISDADSFFLAAGGVDWAALSKSFTFWRDALLLELSDAF